MRVAILTETFERKMGYMGSMFPRYLARQGVDVHVVALDLPPYYHLKDFASIYGGFTGSGDLVPGAVETIDGFTLHVLPHRKILGYMRMKGLGKKLRAIRPDIVYSMAAIGWIPLDAVLWKLRFRYKLFTGSHTTASVFPLARQEKTLWSWKWIRNSVTRALPGRIVGSFTEKCYGATVDCAEVAVKCFGVPRGKVDVCPLGVDTGIFRPVRTGEDSVSREVVRNRFGFAERDIVCIYTGRFSRDKNPLLLARAVADLAGKGHPYRGLFLGNGEQADAIRNTPGCTVHPFVPVDELGRYFRAADIGVWPTQESTSMLDAAACGLPIVVNDTLAAVERVEGNGIRYRLNDPDALVEALMTLGDPAVRKRLGDCGAEKMEKHFSWEKIARRRLRDFEEAFHRR